MTQVAPEKDLISIGKLAAEIQQPVSHDRRCCGCVGYYTCRAPRSCAVLRWPPGSTNFQTIATEFKTMSVAMELGTITHLTDASLDFFGR